MVDFLSPDGRLAVQEKRGVQVPSKTAHLVMLGRWPLC